MDTFPDALAHFERKWAAWTAICLSQIEDGGNMYECIETDEFEAIKRLGSKIIPFVMFKLAKDDGDRILHGVFLYNALENDAGYRVALATDDSFLVSRGDWRNLSSQIVELNCQRNRIFGERVRAWVVFYEEHWLQSSSLYFTMCEEHWDLVDMGASVIAPLMVEYERMEWGYWFQLLHETVHGRKLGSFCYQKSFIHAECVKWFNEGDHNEAPLYTPTELEEYIMPDSWN